MAGVTNGLILCLLSVFTTPMAYGARNQSSQIEPVVTIQQSPTQIFALKNTPLILPCGINTTAEIQESWWLKNGIRLQSSNRFRFKNLDLEFEKLEQQTGDSLTDDGKYRCVVKLQSGSILGPLRLVSIAALEKSVCSGSVVEGLLTQNIVLPCCIKSVPSGNVSWTKVGSVEVNPRLKQLNSGNLLILNLTVEDIGSYRCVVHNDFFKKVKEAAVHLSVQSSDVDAGLRILDTFESDLILRNESVHLFCAANGYPRPTTTWIITFESNNQIQTKFFPISSINVSTSNITGNFTCVASDGVHQVTRTVMVKLPPSFPNPPILTYPPAKTVRFECRSPLSSIVWYKDGHILITNKGRIKHKNGELVISNTIRNDSGFYQCESENYIGTGQLLIEAPKERLDVPVSLNCTSTSSTLILVKWRSPSGRNVQAFSVHYTPFDGGEERQRVTNNTTVLIEALVPNTNYSIYVRSYSGSSASGQSQHVFCATLEDFPTVAPTLLFVNQVGPSSQYRIRWNKLTRQEARGTIQHYKLQWRVSDESFSKVQILRGDSEEFIIAGLLPSTHYSLRLLPATSVGYPHGKDIPWTNFETGNSNTTFASPEINVSAVNATTVVTFWQYEFDQISEDDEEVSGFRLLLGQLDSFEEIVYRPIIYLGPNEQEFCFTDLTPATLYQVSLQSFTESWESSLATKNIWTEGEGQEPNVTNMVTVENLEAKPISATEISLKWSRPVKADVPNYVVRFKPVDSREVTSLNNITSETLVVGKLKPYASYEFDVAFQVDGICGPFSQKVEAMTLQGTPSAPSSPHFEVLNKTSIQLSWQPPSSSNGIIKGYLVEQQFTNDSSQRLLQFNTTETKLILSHLQQNKEYVVRIAAETAAGLGEFSMFIYPRIFSTNGTSRTDENGEMIQDKPEINNTTSSGVSGSSQQELGLVLGVLLGLLSIVICTLIIIWRNTCFSFIVSRGRRVRTVTYMNGGVEKDTVDSPGMEMINLRSARNSQSYLDTKGGLPTAILSGNASDPLLMGVLRNPEHRSDESERGSDGEDIDRISTT